MKTIVVGAGAAGLMAASELSAAGVEVVVLEAKDRIGGRVHTFTPSGFTNFVEAGAEFIHGNLPVTKRLMKKARLEYAKASMDMLKFENGVFAPDFNSVHWQEFAKKAFALKRDCTLSEFLGLHFRGAKYETFREECFEMAQGLDLADPLQLSVFCIREEWTSTETQFRPIAGYSPLLGFLADTIASNRGQILLNQHVTRIEWANGRARAFTPTHGFEADAVIVTVPLGVLQQRKIAFEPKFDDRFFDEIGFGEVIKIAMEFEYPFWEETHAELGFLFTAKDFTFWTQLELKRPVLMGWIGNDKAFEMSQLADELLVQELIAELTDAFPNSDVKGLLRAQAVFRYTRNDATAGGYSWTMPQSRAAISEINKGISGTIYFAGEAFERTADVGTVEAALKSGRYIARKILKST